MTHSPTTSAEKVEQRHRDAAADAYDAIAGCTIPISFGKRVRAGEESELAQAFARFEREHMSAALPPTPEPVADQGEGLTDWIDTKITPDQRESLFASLHSLICSNDVAEIPAVMESVISIFLSGGHTHIEDAATPPADQLDANMVDHIEYEVWQQAAFGVGEGKVAGSTSLTEAQEYAAVYSQDAPAWVVEVRRHRLAKGSGDAETVGWRDIGTFETEPHGQANRVLIVCGTTVGEAWYRDSEGANDSDSGWWWAGTGPDDYWSSPVSETNELPRLWRPLPAPPAKGSGQGGGE